MKAIQYTAYGNSDVLKLTQVNVPFVDNDEVLIKIKAITVNPFEIKVRKGLMQKMMPIQFPFIPGSDAAGVIEKVGSGVADLKVGDEVFTSGASGTYAEYTVAKAKQVALMPTNSSFNEAASLAVPLVTSYSVLVEQGKVKSGQRILMHGAGGAVGQTMVQMAKALGAYVIGTASGNAVEHLRNLGADESIDYKSQDFTALVKDVDLVADLVGGETQQKSFSLLKRGGLLVSIVMPPSAELAAKYSVEARFVSSTSSTEKLEFGKKMVEAGNIQAQIAKVMKLEQAAEAQDLLWKGGINGKIVLVP